MRKILNNIWVVRSMFLLFAIALTLGGLQAVLFGDLHYENYWGGLVFAPLAIVAGVFVMPWLAWKWKTLSAPEKRPPLKGRAARLARQAEETRFPIDDYEKW